MLSQSQLNRSWDGSNKLITTFSSLPLTACFTHINHYQPLAVSVMSFIQHSLSLHVHQSYPDPSVRENTTWHKFLLFIIVVVWLGRVWVQNIHFWKTTLAMILFTLSSFTMHVIVNIVVGQVNIHCWPVFRGRKLIPLCDPCQSSTCWEVSSSGVCPPAQPWLRLLSWEVVSWARA